MITEKIILPEDVQAEIDSEVFVKGAKGELRRKFKMPGIKIKKEGSSIIVEAERERRKEKKILYTITAHIRNMIHGVKEGFEYKLQVCSVHFPITVVVDNAKNILIIKNFLGEDKDRIAKILPNVDVKIDGDIITVNSPDKEAAGQTAANFEVATRIRAKDRRVFADGIWITEKAGKKE